MGYKDIFKIPAKTIIGQHFLTDKKILDLIAKQIPYNCKVLEIGAGPGQLTEILVKKTNKISAIEIDKQFIPLLTDLQKKYDNLDLIFDNALKVDFKKFTNFWLIGNLPYHIIEPLIDKVIRSSFLGIVFLVGNSFVKEALALNLNDFESFGKLSLAIYTFFEANVLISVDRKKFNPKPRTNSAVLILKPRDVDVYQKSKKMFLLRRLFLTSHNSALTKNVLMNALIDFHGKELTKNESRKMVDQLKLPNIILEKSFEQLNNKEYLILYKSFN